ncbi:cysteine desulfurase NifS [soil metagenome]
MHYFDYAAATPLSSHVLVAMEPYFAEQFYNPSAQYLAAQKVHKAVEQARADVAGTLKTRPQEIIFTAGGTEANNLAIHGVMARFPGANCVVSAVEHDAVMEPAGQYSRKLAAVNPDGRIDTEALEKLIDDKTVLISVMFANNEIGTVQPLAEISKLVKEIRERRQADVIARAKGKGQRAKKTDQSLSLQPLPLLFHTDACQAPNYLRVLPNTLGVDLMTLNGGKMYGPKQSGILFVKTGVELEPLIYGGGQEKSLRSGTENIAGIIGFAKALVDSAAMREAEWLRLVQIQAAGYDFIQKELSKAIINGSKTHRLPNNLHITLPGHDNERLMMALDEQGFMVAAGSACSASSDEPSHVLRAIGLTDAAARSSIRITMGRQTNHESVLKLLATIKELAQ